MKLVTSPAQGPDVRQKQCILQDHSGHKPLTIKQVILKISKSRWASPPRTTPTAGRRRSRDLEGKDRANNTPSEAL